MSAAANRVLIVILARALSCGVWFGSVLVPHLYLSKDFPSWKEVSTFLPAPTVFAVDCYPSYILVVCALAATALGMSAFRAASAFTNLFGIGFPLLVGWCAVFGLTYGEFLGPTSMHHPQLFELDRFLFSDYGLYACSLLLIVGLLGLFARDALRLRREGKPSLPG